MNSNEKLPKTCFKFYCENCDYGTCKKSSYDDHLITAKHIKSMNGNENLPKICSPFICENCSKKYKDNSGLWRHKKKCKKLLNENTSSFEEKDLTDKDIIKMLIKENSEFKNMILEVVKSIQPNNTTNNTTHKTTKHIKHNNINNSAKQQ